MGIIYIIVVHFVLRIMVLVFYLLEFKLYMYYVIGSTLVGT